MEYIKDALIKAKASLDPQSGEASSGSAPDLIPYRVKQTLEAAKVSEKPVAKPSWKPPRFELDPKHLERNRIVAASMDDPNHIAFNLLRTRVRKTLQDNRWKSIAITSPTPGCGKTMISVNLAYSLARAPNFKTVLIDLDLRRPAVGRTLGATSKASIAEFLEGEADAEDCFVEVSPNLFVGLNEKRVRHSSELIQSQRVGELVNFVNTTLSPDAILFDLPPMFTCDDALAFMPRIDSTLLVAAAGATTVSEVDECEQQISQLDKLFGVILNKAEERAKDYYYY